MTGKNHIKIAFSVSLLTLNPVVIGYSILGSILPDIDHYKSMISKFIIAPYITKVLTHRGFTHSILGFITVTLTTIITIHRWDIVAGIAIGYISHIVADMLTSQGVQLMWPKRKRYKFPFTFSTGSEYESIFTNVSVILSIYYAVTNLNI